MEIFSIVLPLSVAIVCSYFMFFSWTTNEEFSVLMFIYLCSLGLMMYFSLTLG